MVGVLVGVFVGVLVGVSVGVLVGVSVGVFVGVLVGVLVGVSVGVLVGVKVGVLVGVFVGVFVGVLVGVGVGIRTVTVSEALLFVSLYSSTLPLGSAITVFARLPAAVGETENVMLNELLTGRVAPNAPAVQLKAVPLIEQLIVPVGAVPPFVTGSEIWG